MANVFGFGPMGATPATSTQANDDPKKRIEGLARSSKVPANVLMALEEGGVKAEDAVARLSSAAASGRSMDEALAEALGNPDTAKKVMSRAYDIADQMYPRSATPAAAEVPPTHTPEGRPIQADAIRDVPASLGSAISQGVGSAVRGVGEAAAISAQEAAKDFAAPVVEAFTGQKPKVGPAANVLAPVADVFGDKGLGGYLEGFVSEEVMREKAELIDPNADLFKPSTWQLGPKPTVRGAIYSTIDVFGSMAPVVAASLITKNPAVAAGVGGAMSAGDAAQNAERTIDEMAAKKGKDGRTQLEVESTVYRRFLAQGLSPEEALFATKRKAAQLSAAYAAIPGALGGAATSKIVNGLEGVLAKLPLPARVVGGAAISGAEEGTQEAAEGIAGRAGLNEAAGIDRSTTAGTLNEFVLGALGGGPVGAISGAAHSDTATPPPPPPAATLAGPQNPGADGSGPRTAPAGNGASGASAPAGATPSARPAAPVGGVPTVIGTMETVKGNSLTGKTITTKATLSNGEVVEFEGSLNDPNTAAKFNEALQQQYGQTAAPPPSGPLGASANAAMGATPAPAGPLQGAAAVAPDMTPQPEATPLFPEYKAGASVRLKDPETQQIIEATFLGESPSGVSLRFNGGELGLEPQEFDAAVQAAKMDDEAAKVAVTGKPTDVVAPTLNPATGNVESPLGATPQTPKQETPDAAPANPISADIQQPPASGAVYGTDANGDGGRGAEALGNPEQPQGGSDSANQPAVSGSEEVAPSDVGQPQPDAALNGGIEYPKRKLGMSRAKADPVVDGIGDNSDDSLGNVALANAQEGDNLPGIGIVHKVTDKQIQIRTADGKIQRYSVNTENLQKLARDMGSLIAGSANLSDEKLGSLLDMIERDDAMTYQSGVPVLIDDPAVRGERPPRNRKSVLKPLFPAPEAKPQNPEPDAAAQPDQESTQPQSEISEPKQDVAGASEPNPTQDRRPDDAEVAQEKEADPLIAKGIALKLIMGLGGKITDKEAGGMLEAAGYKKPAADDVLEHIVKHARIGNTAQGPDIEMDSRHQGNDASEGMNAWAWVFIVRSGWYPWRGDFRKPSKEFLEFLPAAKEKLKELAAKPDAEAQPADAENGPFGPILTGYEGDWKAAALELERRQTGEATGALTHPVVGPIALVWGEAGSSKSDGMGLSKIIAWHPEVLDDLQGRIEAMRVTSQTENRIQLESESDRAGVRLDWDGKSKVWLIGAYSKDAPRRPEKFTGTLSSLWEGMAPPAQRGNGEDAPKDAENQASPIDAAAAEADPEPTPAQAEAGNYKKGHAPWKGLDLTFENEKGSTRSGVGADGQEWSVTMPAHYGYIKRTTGADGEQVDFYFGDEDTSDYVWLVDQVDAETGKFDEHKAILGVTGPRKARAIYLAGFSDGKGEKRLGGATPMTVESFKEWLASGDTTKPMSARMKGKEEADAKKADKEPKSEKPATGEKPVKIDDFGEKIGGMRKDASGRYVQQLAGGRAIATMSLSEAFPIPDYVALAAEGVPAENLALLGMIRASIGRKPHAKKPWRVSDWAEKIEHALEMARELIEDADSYDATFADATKGYRSGKIGLNADDTRLNVNVFSRLSPEDMAEVIGTMEVKSTLWETAGDFYGLMGRESYVTMRSIISTGRYIQNGKGEKLTSAQYDQLASHARDYAEALRRERDARGPRPAADEKPVEILVRQWKKSKRWDLFVYEPTRITLTNIGFPGSVAAKKYLDDNRETLEALVRERLKGARERMESNRERIGPAWRQGDATEEMFTKELGFRGVAFGKSLPNKERQLLMNETYDAMMDLAGLLNVPAKTLSLNGRIGLGFGTHGKGGRGHWGAVFFQSSDAAQDQVIALTRHGGPGALAHEWWHAVDNFLARDDARESDVSAAISGKNADRRNEFMSDRLRARGMFSDEEYATFKELRSKLVRSAWRKRMLGLDQAKGKPYYATIIELAARGFERLVIDDLYKRDMVNDFLANVDQRGGAYPSTREFHASGIADAFTAAINVVRVKLDVEGKSGPKIFDKMPEREIQAPKVGDRWEWAGGFREIVSLEDGAGFNGGQLFKVQTDGVEKPELKTEDQLEVMLAADEYSLTPVGRAEYAAAEAEKKAAADLAATQAARDADKADKTTIKKDAARAAREAVPDLVAAFERATGKKGTLAKLQAKMWRYTDIGVLDRAQFAVWAIQSGGRVTADSVLHKDGWVLTDKEITLHGMEFAKWYKARWDADQTIIQQAQQQNDQAGAEDEAEDLDPSEVEVSPAIKADDQPDTGLTLDQDFYDLIKHLIDDEMTPEPAEQNAEPESIDVPADFTDMIGDLINEEVGPEPSTPKLSPDAAKITTAFLEEFRAGRSFRTIVQARKRASEALDRDVAVEEYLMVEEAIELAVVKRAREIIAAGERSKDGAVAIYGELMDLYAQQPILGERTPDKMTFQAYSTPAPLAYVASRLAGIGPKTRVVEPTAGNGMLAMEADPKNVQANELQPSRAAQLADVMPGAALTQSDALDVTFKPFDVLITNPPFGKLTDQETQTRKVFSLGVTSTKEIDHAIAWHTLSQMPDDGRAVLILGGIKKQIQGDDRAKAYQERSKLVFFKQLYDTYNVVDHFTVAGELYNRQGAGWPVDVIVIDGRAASSRDYPMKTAPAVLSTWVEVGRKLNDAPDVETEGRGPDDSGDRAEKPQTDQKSGGVSGPRPVPPLDDDRASGPRDAGGSDAGAGGMGDSGVGNGRGGGSGGAGGLGTGGRGAGGGAGNVSGNGGSDGQRPGDAGSDLGNDDSGVREPSIGERLNNAASAAGQSYTDALDGLLNLFGGPNTLNSGLTFSKESYEKAKPLFISAVRNAKVAAKEIYEVLKAIISDLAAMVRKRGGGEKEVRGLLENMTPYMNEFAKEVSSGRLDPYADPKAETKPTEQRVNTEEAGEYQVQYMPRSKSAYFVGTLVPKAMGEAITRALNRVEQEHGDIDAYVAGELGYTLGELLGTKEKPGYFSAEQVDALALAIKNVSEGRGFINGDQTGVGKGRFVAAMLRYAERKGKIPVFVSQKPGLYADMVRDMRDIGMADVLGEVIATNTALKSEPVPINDDTDLFYGPTKKEYDTLVASLRQGKLPEGKKYLFTTYDQMKTRGGRLYDRAEALRQAAPNIMLVLDESHTAGGDASGSFAKVREDGQEEMNVALFFRELVQNASGSVFASATYAKNPAVMSLYSSTNLSLAVPDINKLATAIEKGGVPLQQVIANQLTADGQYIRRERSFAGVEFGPVEMTTDRNHAIEVSRAIGELATFDREYMEPARADFKSNIGANGFLPLKDGSVGIASSSSADFASTVHNLVSQFLLAVKLDSAVDLAIKAWKNGEKPVITLMNVNTSIMEEYLTDMGLKIGDSAEIPFATIIERYLERLRRIKFKDVADNEFYYRMTDEDLGETVVQELENIRQMIETLPLKGLTGNPVDAIRDKLEAAGMKVDEITGRQTIVRNGIVASHTGGPSENKRRMNAFNKGDLDAVILSASGSTGFSLHATDKKNNDGKQRHMIVLQPHPDINVFMQTLGRVHRTGQIKLPKYSLAFSDLAIEKRAAAVLMKKMASLNANTTAGKRSATTLDVVDFVNEVGDTVVAEYLAQDEHLAHRLGFDGVSPDRAPADFAKKVTGRFIYLHPDEVVEHYDNIELAYQDKLRELEAAGTNPLEAKTLDLDAKTLSRATLSEGSGTTSELDQDLVVEEVSVKLQGIPFKSAKVDELVEKALDGGSVADWADAKKAVLDELMPDHTATMKALKAVREEKLKAAIELRYEAEMEFFKAGVAHDKARGEPVFQHWSSASREYKKAFYGDTVKDRKGNEGKIIDMMLKLDPNGYSTYFLTIEKATGEKVDIERDDASLVSEGPRTKESDERINALFKAREAANRNRDKLGRDVVEANNGVNQVNERIGQEEARLSRVVDALKTNVYPGKPYTINSADTDIPAVVIDVDLSKLASNPTAAGRIRVTFAVADSIQKMTFPLSQVLDGGTNLLFTPESQHRSLAIKAAFDAGQSARREKRQIATGNLIAGIARFDRAAGQVVLYTTDSGEIRPGILFPKKFDVNAAIKDADVAFPDTATAFKFIDQHRQGFLKTEDKVVSFTGDGYGFKITVQKNGKGGAKGRPYFQLQAANKFINRFREVGKTYVGHISRDDLKSVLDAYESNLGTRYLVDSHKDEARAIIGVDLPSMDTSGTAESRFLDPIPAAALRPVTADLNRELAKMGLSGKVTPLVVRDLMGKLGVQIAGRATGATVEINEAAGDKLGILRHEVIHVLRDASLWGNPQGLFTAEEWRTLVAAARSNDAIMARVAETYARESAAVRVEEAVAELFREWAAKKDGSGVLGRAMGRIASFFRALGSALRGSGFIDHAMVMERIANGTVGGRGPDGGKGKGRSSEMRDNAPSGFLNQFRQDNPRGEWLRRKREAAEEAMRTAPSTSYRSKGLGGAVTGYHKGVVMLPVAELAKLKGAQDERRVAGDPKFDSLLADARKRGFVTGQDGNAVLVGINHKGQAYLLEGNTRVAVASLLGVKSIRAEVRWMNGGEMTDGPFSPANVSIMADSVPQQGGAEMRFGLVSDKVKALTGRKWRTPAQFTENALTDAMNGADGDGVYSTLSLVPGRALFSELGKWSFAAKAYMRDKENMDALRNEWHASADGISQAWLKLARKNPKANTAFMDLLHEATIAGIDPTTADPWEHPRLAEAVKAVMKYGSSAPKLFHTILEQQQEREQVYNELRAKFTALPSGFKDMWGRVIGQYDRLADDFETAITDNIRKGIEVAIKRAEREYRKEVQRIDDEGLTGAPRNAALADAKAKLAAVKARGGYNAKARISTLRKSFESNRLKGPYVPLARFGNFFVTIRDEKGKVINFSRFEKKADMDAFVKEQTALNNGRVQFGAMDNVGDLKAQVDPTFVAEVEGILADTGAEPEVMDAVWQRWLETLPDRSIRTSKIHRKNREGYSKDAFRAFGKHMFHGAHQLARLRYGLGMEEHLNDASEEAEKSTDPVRNALVVREMRRRHQFTMNPTGNAVLASLSGLAFIWYLGATPAAAVANVSQTSVVGIPVMMAKWKKAGITGVIAELTKAVKDYAHGKGHTDKSSRLTDDERRAVQAALKRGTIDKTQAHDLASVAETGIEYNAARERVMRVIGKLFHEAERFNREITFLANYRLAKKAGMAFEDAVDAGADMTWKIHFDYQNTSRPRIMQNDLGKMLSVFRQYTVNVLWRLFRDTHQALKGATKEDRAEARTQLIGITLSMMAHAGIRGTWGYGLIMMGLGMFFPGGGDDAEKWLHDALLMEGDDAGTAAWNYAMGAAINGVPGHLLRLDLSERIGMPNLWFRGPSQDLEGEDLYSHYVGELLGPVYGIGDGIFRGVQMAADGDWYRGAEAAVPKVVRDAMKAGRFAVEGATTRKGDPLIEGVSWYQMIAQLNGFTPAQLAERYDINNRLKNEEKRIVDRRAEIHRRVGDAIREGIEVPAKVLKEIEAFNAEYPEYPITGDSIRRSYRARQMQSSRSEFGVTINPRLNERLREEEAPSIYN